METRKAVSIYLRPSLITRLEASAAANNRTLSNYIESALESTHHPDGSPTLFPTTTRDYQGMVGNASQGPALSQAERTAQAKRRR